MIWHYEKIGPIAAAVRRASGYRDYDQQDVHTLRFVRRSRDLDLPIEEIGKLVAARHDRGRATAPTSRRGR